MVNTEHIAVGSNLLQTRDERQVSVGSVSEVSRPYAPLSGEKLMLHSFGDNKSTMGAGAAAAVVADSSKLVSTLERAGRLGVSGPAAIRKLAAQELLQASASSADGTISASITTNSSSLNASACKEQRHLGAVAFKSSDDTNTANPEEFTELALSIPMGSTRPGVAIQKTKSAPKNKGAFVHHKPGAWSSVRAGGASAVAATHGHGDEDSSQTRGNQLKRSRMQMQSNYRNNNIRNNNNMDSTVGQVERRGASGVTARSQSAGVALGSESGGAAAGGGGAGAGGARLGRSSGYGQQQKARKELPQKLPPVVRDMFSSAAMTASEQELLGAPDRGQGSGHGLFRVGMIPPAAGNDQLLPSRSIQSAPAVSRSVSLPPIVLGAGQGHGQKQMQSHEGPKMAHHARGASMDAGAGAGMLSSHTPKEKQSRSHVFGRPTPSNSVSNGPTTGLLKQSFTNVGNAQAGYDCDDTA
jgi:hypothetical protein